MNGRALRVAGFFAMTSAVLTVPLLLASYYFNEADERTYLLPLTLMQLAGLFLFVYLNLFLKKFLHLRFTFYETDAYIDFLVMVNIFLSFSGIAELFFTTLEEPLGLFSLLLILCFGAGEVFFALKLSKLPDSLRGMLKPLCVLTAITGILVITVFLLPLAALTSAISDVVLGTIFFQASENPPESDLT